MISTCNTAFYLSGIIGLIWSVLTAAAEPAGSPLPLEKGMRWSYEGKVEWTGLNSAGIFSTNVHWVMEVVDSMEKDMVRAAVVRGLLTELAWYEPNQMPGFTVLVSITNQVYRIPAASEQDSKNLARRLVNAPYTLPPSAEEWLVFPLGKGKRWGGDIDRKDNNYCWYVREKQAKRLRVEGYPPTHLANVWTLTYRTCPDHQIMDIVIGLGVTRYVYGHHGTVASADVRLVSVRYPAKAKR
jgi:hypothetical protein